MKVILRGSLAEGTQRREVKLAANVPLTREDLLRTLAGEAPTLARYCGPSAETGNPMALLVVAGGDFVHPGQLIAADAEVEIHPPISGG